MATVYSTQRTNALANPVVNSKTNEIGGRVRIAHGVFEASSLASGDVIEMFKLPNGARIISGKLCHDAMGSSTTLAVGHAAYVNSAGTTVAADADEFKTAAASTSAQCVDIANFLGRGSGIEIDANEDGYIVTATMGGAAGTGTIEVTMLYALD